jgi:hypothetical protein
MRKFSFGLAVAVICLSISGVMMAQDNPLVGTWKLNLEKSKYSAGMAPKSLTRTVSVDGDSVKYSFEGAGPDGAALMYAFTVKYDGKDYDITGSGAPYSADHIAIKRINSHSYSATLKKDGKIVGTSTATVSKDGKTTTVAGKGKDAKGNSLEATQVYEKQ